MHLFFYYKPYIHYGNFFIIFSSKGFKVFLLITNVLRCVLYTSFSSILFFFLSNIKLIITAVKNYIIKKVCIFAHIFLLILHLLLCGMLNDGTNLINHKRGQYPLTLLSIHWDHDCGFLLLLDSGVKSSRQLLLSWNVFTVLYFKRVFF